MPTFAQNFNIGDVVYGISASRAPYIASLPGDTAAYCRDSGAYVICDEFNNRSFLGLTNDQLGVTRDHTQYASTIKNPVSINDIRYNLDFYQSGRGLAVLSEEQKIVVKVYYDALNNSRRSPEKALADAPQKRHANNDSVTMFAIRRACKFGLEHNINVRKVCIHFVLDIPYQPGMNMDDQQVVNKVKFNGANPSTDEAASVPITFSELRCCYRSRAVWMPTGRLKFYSNLNEVPAPWVSAPAVWQQYDAYRANKAFKKKHPIQYAFGKRV